MKTKYLLFGIALLSISFTACKKAGLHPTTHDAVVDTAVDVYAAGYITTSNGMGGTAEVAAYWKNGVLTRLTDSLSFAEATGIAVNGSDVYVVGYTSSPSNQFNENAVLWKNGVATMLSPDSAYSEATCIGLMGTDVYVGGFVLNVNAQTSNSTSYANQPVYWKNGSPNLLPMATGISSIAVSGSDVYFAGSIVSTNKFQATGPLGPGSTAAYWKNGSMPDTLGYPDTYLNAYSSGAVGIAVSGNTVYATGATGIYAPEFWQNGTPTILAETNNHSVAYGIATNGTDVYVAGMNGNYYNATYWKNNQPVPLSAGALSMTNSFATAAAVNGNDIYVVGQVKHAADQEYASYYWKNGVPVELSAGSGGHGAYVKAVALAPKN